MSAAALTPRVRFLAVCDEAVCSEIEDEVYTLERVRHRIHASSFPCLHSLSVYLLLSHRRKGTFRGVYGWRMRRPIGSFVSRGLTSSSARSFRHWRWQ